mmetsp:Transcript_106283/g.188982  ORF Transcript_106283/g.188982 Transcript_106283/m.188982 type:complete len:296 (+) Transcript_106283:31-918(+)|eukprot:CAMPEP_0197650386 /NCGR_PEP_ID=MMETSP1338-20131121/30915_1 /TAXON_ID=43686 ORGANISM="Pelagodinium beii, Strain RCC1491" /NCGR_SAMPLE_ID=MMETSP1338 /ASSEMBLY_ACC=CAM_ASM_000754 /LENGTH=295 /DNA_ID=CAMNT_0043224783 /DNA_START=31 /DNA_END=918 /DNA_ORIENTATION=-
MAPAMVELEEPILRFSSLDDAQKLSQKEERGAQQYHGLDLSMLDGLNQELLGHALEFCRSCSSSGALLRLAHCELGSGTSCEQKVYDLKVEKTVKENEKVMHVHKKSESSKQKDFAVSAQMRNAANAGIQECEQRLADVALELSDLEQTIIQTPWWLLFSQMQGSAPNKIKRLDLSDCGLHAVGVQHLQEVLLDLEHRGDGIAVEELVLDGNDLGDSATVALAALVRLSSCLAVLRLRNIGVTDGGFSQILSGLVSNKSLLLLDLRGNGLCSPEISKAATEGFRRFNKTVQILLD